MPDWAAVIALGIIEGITEFLPVSSTGHLLLVENMGWLPRQSDLFNVVIQSGTAVAVALAFSTRLGDLVARRREPAARSFVLKLAMAFFITAAGGLVARRLGFALPREAEPVAWATLVGGCGHPDDRALAARQAAARARSPGHRGRGGAGPAPGRGVPRHLALRRHHPGGAGARAGRIAATEFSFLLGIPTLLAAGGYEALHAMRHPDPVATSWTLVLLGTAVSALAALVTVRWLLRFVQTHTFVGFGWYRVALGLAILVAPRGSA